MMKGIISCFQPDCVDGSRYCAYLAILPSGCLASGLNENILPTKIAPMIAAATPGTAAPDQKNASGANPAPKPSTPLVFGESSRKRMPSSLFLMRERRADGVMP